MAENTALCRYWEFRYSNPPRDPLCSLCDNGKWHGCFDRRPYDELFKETEGKPGSKRLI